MDGQAYSPFLRPTKFANYFYSTPNDLHSVAGIVHSNSRLFYDFTFGACFNTLIAFHSFMFEDPLAIDPVRFVIVINFKKGISRFSINLINKIYSSSLHSHYRPHFLRLRHKRSQKAKGRKNVIYRFCMVFIERRG